MSARLLLLWAGAVVFAGAAVPRHTDSDPPDTSDMHKLECQLHQLAFEWGSAKVRTNAQAIYDALHLGDLCAPALTPLQQMRNERLLAEIPSHREQRRRLQHNDGSAEVAVYVAPNGSDSNPGTKSAPFATLRRARNALRSLPAAPGAGPSPRRTVYVREGKYHLATTLELDRRDSNTLWTAFPGEAVVLSGGLSLRNLTWAPFRDRVLVANVQLPDTRARGAPLRRGGHDWGPAPALVNQLFADGVRLVRARFPNGNPHDATGQCFHRPQRPGEGCPGHVVVAGGAGELPPGTKVASLSLDLNRGNSPTLGCPQCTKGPQTFHYTIYDPPDGHPVYDTPGAAVPGWPNRSLLSFWGSPFSRGSRFSVNPVTWTNRTWAHPETAVVHMFHGLLWGGWQFQVAGFDGKTFQLGYGGYQEARGGGFGGNHYYVENVLEELDTAGEWFYDASAHKLYLQPNTTGIAPRTLVAPILNTLIRISDGAANITVDGFELTETRATFLDRYEVPSGGDWSVHRGAAVEVGPNASGVLLRHNLFNSTGGNAVLLSGHVVRSAVRGNEFVHTGDSAIVSLGTADGVDGTAPTFPDGTVVAGNHIHEYGVYGKQTSCYMQALTARSTVSSNVCYNGPRAGLNYNDGFFGGYDVSHNLLFNHVRETADHGPFNSWDRQPYLTDNGVRDGFPPRAKPPGLGHASLIARQSHVHHNFIINGYSGVWAIDHDDGSQRYNDTANLMVWGGCKNFLGNSKSCDHNTMVYPGRDDRSLVWGGKRCQTDDNGVFANQYFTNNTCFTDGAFYSFSQCTTADLATTVYRTARNRLYAPRAAWAATCGVGSFAEWQALGQDRGSRLAPTPSVEEIVALANRSLVWGGR